MNEGKLAAEFFNPNIETVLQYARSATMSIDEFVQIKIKSAYSSYLKSTYETFSKSKSFFIRDRSINLYSYYVQTRIRSYRTTINIPTFNNCTQESTKILLIGSGGTGKSILMRHLFLDCIVNKQFVPIFIELRDLNTGKLALDDAIAASLDTHGFKITGSYIEAAKLAGHFCFFLDGFDEVSYNYRQNLLARFHL